MRVCSFLDSMNPTLSNCLVRGGFTVQGEGVAPQDPEPYTLTPSTRCLNCHSSEERYMLHGAQTGTYHARELTASLRLDYE